MTLPCPETGLACVLDVDDRCEDCGVIATAPRASDTFEPGRLRIPSDVAPYELGPYEPSGQTMASMGWSPEDFDDARAGAAPAEAPVAEPSAETAPAPADESPSACDVCEGAFDGSSLFRRLSVVSDMAPRTLGTRSPQILEEEWTLIVCESCHADFFKWLFRSESELDTLPAPPNEPVARRAGP